MVSTEDEMHADPSLCYRNSSSAVAIAALVDRFAIEGKDSLSLEIKRLMESCATGTGRLASPLLGTGAVFGHKTGTGFTLPDGRLQAVNDVGYVLLPDGRRYAIAVLVADSEYTMAETEAIIAHISTIVNNIMCNL